MVSACACSVRSGGGGPVLVIRWGDVTAPACGLHFVDSIYDERFELPKEPLGPNLLAFTGEWTGERVLPESPRVAARRRLTFSRQAKPEQQETSS